MTPPLAHRNYVALTLTLTAGSPQRLLDLINAALASQNAECPGACRELNLQNAAGNTVSIYIGEENVSNTSNGYELVAGSAGAVGASRTYRGPVSCVPLASLYTFVTAAAGQKLSVEVTVL